MRNLILPSPKGHIHITVKANIKTSLAARGSLKTVPTVLIHSSLTHCSTPAIALGRGVLMAFHPQALVSNIDWVKIETNTPKWVIGRSQYIYWKECNVIAVEKDSDGRDTETKVPFRDSEGAVPSGTELYLSGSGGKINRTIGLCAVNNVDCILGI